MFTAALLFLFLHSTKNNLISKLRNYFSFWHIMGKCILDCLKFDLKIEYYKFIMTTPSIGNVEQGNYGKVLSQKMACH